MMSNWSLLPPDILVIIFGLLNDEDRCHASRTCRAWHCVSKTPCLWRRQSFVFRGYCRSYAHRLTSVKGCIQAVGCHMRELNLSCPTPNLLTAHNVTKCVRALFTEIFALVQYRKSKLHSFILKDLDFDETWSGFRSSRAQLVSSLTFFLAYQQRLKLVDMTNAFMTSPFAFRTMDALTWSRSAKSVEEIRLENFFSSTVSPVRLLQVMRSLFRACSRLKRISINSCYLNDKSLLLLSSRLGDTLQQLNLHVSCRINGSAIAETTNNSILPKVWKEITAHLCPDLKVTLNFDYWPTDFSSHLTPNMPLVELNVRGFICGACRASYASSVNRLFSTLSQNYSKSLMKISLLLRFGHRPYYSSIHMEDLLAFWRKCPRLQTAIFSQDLVMPHNNRNHRWNINSSFDIKRDLKLDVSRSIRVRTVVGTRGQEHYIFGVSVRQGNQLVK